jgi:hypothetical protein
MVRVLPSLFLLLLKTVMDVGVHLQRLMERDNLPFEVPHLAVGRQHM